MWDVGRSGHKMLCKCRFLQQSGSKEGNTILRFFFFSFSAGNSLAVKYGCKYIETSPGINHNVDELLVGMLTQIQLRDKTREGVSESVEGSGSGKNNGSISGGSCKKKGGGQKVLDLLQSVWKTNDSKSKSSGNLHVL